MIQSISITDIPQLLCPDGAKKPIRSLWRSDKVFYIANTLNPPSTTATVPVTNFDASDIR